MKVLKIYSRTCGPCKVLESNLHAEMESEIAKKEFQIAALQEDIKTIGVTKQEAETFMSNIEKLI